LNLCGSRIGTPQQSGDAKDGSCPHASILPPPPDEVKLIANDPAGVTTRLFDLVDAVAQLVESESKNAA
jgi:hypothetical protein